MYTNAHRLFLYAVDLHKSASSLHPASEQARREFLATVIFAAMSTEAFINELPQLAAETSEHSPEPGWVKALGEIVGAAEESRASIESKYHLAHLVLTGEVFDKGRQPFQDFALLVAIRNFVLHAKPKEAVRRQSADGTLTWETELMNRLAMRAAIGRDESLSRLFRPGEPATVYSNLLEEICTQPVALWACKAAAGMVNTVLSTIQTMPAKSVRFGALLKTIYEKDFLVP